MADRGGAPVLVLGIGNRDRGDDGAGRAVAEVLRSLAPEGLEVADSDGEATGLLDRIDGRQRVVIVDACAAGGTAGAVRRFDAAAASLPASAFGVSSHGLGLHQALELARVLGVLPRQCSVYVIEGACFDLGAPLSPAVAAAVRDLAHALIEDIGASAGGATCTRPA